MGCILKAIWAAQQGQRYRYLGIGCDFSHTIQSYKIVFKIKYLVEFRDLEHDRGTGDAEYRKPLSWVGPRFMPIEWSGK
jgi:hypothetical protein